MFDQEHLSLYLQGLVGAVIIISQYLLARQSGKLDPLALARKVVVDAEQLFKPLPNETHEEHNQRKLDYAIKEVQKVYPNLDVAYIINLIETGVRVVKWVAPILPIGRGAENPVLLRDVRFDGIQ